MLKAIALLACLLTFAAACESPAADLVGFPDAGGSSASINLLDWLGTWNCLLTETESCPGQAPVVTSGTSPATFAAFGDAGIAFSTAGCDYDFSLAGDTATLVGPPVTCSNGSTEFSITTFVLTSDGGGMWGSYGGTAAVPGFGTCTAVVTASCRR
jgi:hypothetical protein